MEAPRTADTAFASLKDFQRRTVDHALRRLYYDDDSTGRFLVADEVGMGKTLVARGVIAGAIERLEHEPSVKRIDVLYICSNAEIARQNLAKLDVHGSGTRPLNTRITMLAAQVQDLNRPSENGRKTVNLISFTPGTSFERGHQGGRVQERTLIYALLEPLFAGQRRATRNALARVLRLGVAQRTWDYWYHRVVVAGQPPDPTIADEFRAALATAPERDELEEIVERATGRSQISQEDHKRAKKLIGRLRATLAAVSVDALDPDLVILDEFQRFKHLLESPTPGTPEEEVSKLAGQLFNFPGARVLLLSATPYKLFTLSEERTITGDDHYADFMATTGFLVRENADACADITEAFREYRRALTDGKDLDLRRARVQNLLIKVMSRTERPTDGSENMVAVMPPLLDAPTADDLLGYVAMRRIARDVEAPMSMDYWKSAPYFLNFMDGYKIGAQVRERLDQVDDPLDFDGTPLLTRSKVRKRKAIDPNNARLRGLAASTTGAGMWKLLWLPPSLPYSEPGGVFASADPSTTTKRLIFSSWAAAPSGIASLLSHDALRHMLGEQVSGESDATPRLRYAIVGDRVAGMTALALFTPVPELAALTDPLDEARRDATVVPSRTQLVDAATERVAPDLRPPGLGSSNLSPDTWYWAAPFQFLRNKITPTLADALVSDENEREDGGARLQHLEKADEADNERLGTWPAELPRWVAMVGLAGPANVAWRSLRRVTTSIDPKPETLLRAAAIIGEGFRSLFNRPEVMALLDQVSGTSDETYWQRVLDYCLDGNLQAVMDEYLHHLVGNSSPTNDEEIIELAHGVRRVIALRTAALTAFDPHRPDSAITFNSRFALRYGSARGSVKSDDQSTERLAGVQSAFNSPFWPMVLASTSVGQEGVDFHWWCHSLVHWNLPSNPVDFEQREGRVHRFKGHAVRKNVASVHRVDALASTDPDPWNAAFVAAYEARTEDQQERLGDLWPWWVFPGEAKIQRWIPSLPFSKDIERDERLLRLRGMYRLAFGQPRQEELVELLGETGGNGKMSAALDLRPPIPTMG